MNMILTFTGELLIDRPGRIESTAWPAEVRALTPSFPHSIITKPIELGHSLIL